MNSKIDRLINTLGGHTNTHDFLGDMLLIGSLECGLANEKLKTDYPELWKVYAKTKTVYKITNKRLRNDELVIFNDISLLHQEAKTLEKIEDDLGLIVYTGEVVEVGEVYEGIKDWLRRNPFLWREYEISSYNFEEVNFNLLHLNDGKTSRHKIINNTPTLQLDNSLYSKLEYNTNIGLEIKEINGINYILLEDLIIGEYLNGEYLIYNTFKEELEG